MFGVARLKSRNSEFWLTLIILLIAVVSSIAAYVFWYRLTFFVGSYLFIHWISLIATAFVAVLIPVYYVLKRKRPQNIKALLKVHILGSLVAFVFISVHFAQNLGRLAGALQRLGAGFALYIVLALIVATGIMERYQTKTTLTRYMKGIHKYTVPIFYVVILIHVLEGFNIL
jgi:hypothetical protein